MFLKVSAAAGTRTPPPCTEWPFQGPDKKRCSDCRLHCDSQSCSRTVIIALFYTQALSIFESANKPDSAQNDVIAPRALEWRVISLGFGILSSDLTLVGFLLDCHARIGFFSQFLHSGSRAKLLTEPGRLFVTCRLWCFAVRIAVPRILSREDTSNSKTTRQ